jgi:hypothetical protein
LAAAVVAFLSVVPVHAAPARRAREQPALREIVLVPSVTASAREQEPPPAPPRIVIPGTPPDLQAPAPNRLRPNLFVVWFGSKGTPATDVPPDSTPSASPDTRSRVRDILLD